MIKKVVKYETDDGRKYPTWEEAVARAETILYDYLIKPFEGRLYRDTNIILMSFILENREEIRKLLNIPRKNPYTEKFIKTGERENPMIKQVIEYETTDGEKFSTWEKAVSHAGDMLHNYLLKPFCFIGDSDMEMKEFVLENREEPRELLAIPRKNPEDEEE